MFVTTHYPNRNETWDETYEYEIYKKNQFDFVTKLDDHVKRQLVVRLSKNSQIYFGKDDISEWKNFDNKIFIDTIVHRLYNIYNIRYFKYIYF